MLYDRRWKILSNLTFWDRMWNWECGSAAEKYRYICVKYCDLIGWESREEMKIEMDYTESDK